MKISPDKKVLVTCTDRRLKDQLLRKDFSLMGKVFDNISRPRTYTLYGKYGRITQRELAGLDIVGHSQFKKTKERVYYRNA